MPDQDNEKKSSSRQVKINAGQTNDKADTKDDKDQSEADGRKGWVLLIMAITVVIGLLFSLKAGLPEIKLSLPGVDFNANFFGSKVYEF